MSRRENIKTAIVDVPSILRDKLSDKGVEALLKLLSDVEIHAKDRSIEVAESRFEKRLSEELAKIRIEIAGIRSELKDEIKEVRLSLIKWALGLLIGQTAILLSIFAIFLK